MQPQATPAVLIPQEQIATIHDTPFSALAGDCPSRCAGVAAAVQASGGAAAEPFAVAP